MYIYTAMKASLCVMPKAHCSGRCEKDSFLQFYLLFLLHQPFSSNSIGLSYLFDTSDARITLTSSSYAWYLKTVECPSSGQ